MKNSNFYNTPIRLLPFYFKKIGWYIIILTFVVPLGIKLSHSIILTSNKELFKIILQDFFITGLALIGFSRDKVEDEMSMLIRMKSIISSFVYGLVMTISNPLLSYSTNVSIHSEGFSLFTQMLIMYLFWYSALKYFR